MKPALTANWARREFSELPPILHEAWSKLDGSSRAACTYSAAILAPDTPVQHWAHVLHSPTAKTSLVTWTGRGVREGCIVSVEGKAEVAKRQIETFRLSSVPASKPFRGRSVKGSKKTKAIHARVKALAPPRKSLPAPGHVEQTQSV